MIISSLFFITNNQNKYSGNIQKMPVVNSNMQSVNQIGNFSLIFKKIEKSLKYKR